MASATEAKEKRRSAEAPAKGIGKDFMQAVIFQSRGAIARGNTRSGCRHRFPAAEANNQNRDKNHEQWHHQGNDRPRDGELSEELVLELGRIHADFGRLRGNPAKKKEKNG